MNHDVCNIMQHTLYTAEQSVHASKVACTVVGTTNSGEPFAVTGTNYYPESILEVFGPNIKIGNASGSIHAENGTLSRSPRTLNATLFVTVPPCPNCAKDISAAGIKDVFIAASGFESDWYKRRGHYFRDMSMAILNSAGINTYVLDLEKRTQQRHELSNVPENYTPKIENTVHYMQIGRRTVKKKHFKTYIENQHERFGDIPFAAAFTINARGEYGMTSARAHPSAGYTSEEIATLPQEKYSFILQPLNSMNMDNIKHGRKILGNFLFSSTIPTSREQVDMVGAGLDQTYIGDFETSRDKHGIIAMQQLSEAGIVDYKPL